MNVQFRNITIDREWQQFENVSLDFDKQVTVITGSNGSGKSTILNLMAQHFDWHIGNVATPRKNKAGSLFGWIAGILNPQASKPQTRIGRLYYTDGTGTEISVPSDVEQAQYMPSLNQKQDVKGFYIPSHRALFRYESPQNLPLAAIHYTKGHAFTSVTGSDRERYLNNGGGRRANAHMKEILLGWNIFGHGNQTMDPQPLYIEYFRGFELVLRKLLPPKLDFQDLIIRNNEVILRCGTGEFLMDALSGGLTAIVDIAWKIYMYSDDEHKEFTVLVDEIENHLHPEMQRTILDDLAETFPDVQFIVSTHSPLIVNSHKDAAVYVLDYVNNRIHSTRIDIAGDAKSANQILDEVLGVSFSMPVWAEKSLESITEEFVEAEPTKQNLEKMRKRLDDSGLSDLLPRAIQRIAEKDNDKAT